MKKFAIGLILTIVFSNSYGVVLSPTTLEYNIDKKNSEKIIITNNSTEKLAIEVNVYKLKFNTDGKLYDRQYDNESLMVFPPAVLLDSGDKQAFRLQWLGTKELSQSESYFVRFSQINLTSPNRSNPELYPSINFQVHYNTLVHIYSGAQKPNVTLYVNNNGSARMENNGNRFIYSKNLVFDTPNNIFDKEEPELEEHFIPPYSNIILANPVNVPMGSYYGNEN